MRTSHAKPRSRCILEPMIEQRGIYAMVHLYRRSDEITALAQRAKSGHPNRKAGHHSETVCRARIIVDGNFSDVRCDSNAVSVNSLAGFGLTIRREVDSISVCPAKFLD